MFNIQPQFLMLIIGMAVLMCYATNILSAESNPRKPLIIAHRGASMQAPENTIAAFKKAVDLGFDLIENDVRRTEDGHIVVMHCDDIQRTTTGRGLVERMTLQEIKNVSAGMKFGQEFIGEKVPTLEEAFDAVPENVTYCVEIKQAGIVEDVVRIVEAKNRVNATIIFDSNPESGAMVKKMNPEIPFLFLISVPADQRVERVPSIISAAMKAQADFIGIEYHGFSPELLEAAKRKGLRVWVWTVNNAEDAKKLAAMGVDGIISDCPDVVREALKE